MLEAWWGRFLHRSGSCHYGEFLKVLSLGKPSPHGTLSPRVVTKNLRLNPAHHWLALRRIWAYSRFWPSSLASTSGC